MFWFCTVRVKSQPITVLAPSAVIQNRRSPNAIMHYTSEPYGIRKKHEERKAREEKRKRREKKRREKKRKARKGKEKK